MTVSYNQQHGVNMDLASAALIFSAHLMDKTAGWKYDHDAMAAVVSGIVRTTDDVQEVETLIKIARWESGGFRKDVITCKVRGDHGQALGAFQVHPFNEQERKDLCSADLADQAKVALFHVNDSVKTCRMRGYRGSNLLTVYTHGHCHADQHGVARSHWGDGSELQHIVWTEVHESAIPKRSDAEEACNDYRSE
jgi:hypothetical protein